MIKINLLKTRVATASPGGGGGATGAAATSDINYSSTSYASGGDGLNPRETLVKVFVLLLSVVGLMLYESQNLRTLISALNAVNNQVNDLEAKALAKDKEVEAIKDIEHRARELDDKLKVLKSLSKMRLREVKTLDYIQGAIPEKVWLKSLDYEADKDNAETGHFNFNGFAVSTEELGEFVKRLEDSAYLSEVIVMKNQEVNAPGQTKAVLREFLFTAQVEVAK